jgi:hypothetical protein
MIRLAAASVAFCLALIGWALTILYRRSWDYGW